LKCRRESERQSGERRHAKRERQHPDIDLDSVHGRQARAAQTRKRRDSPERQQQSEAAAGQREQHTLREQLANDPPSPGPERGANGHFLLPRIRAREQKVGHVGARNEQHKPNRPQQHQKRLPYMTDDLFVQRNHPEAGIAAERQGEGGVELNHGRSGLASHALVRRSAWSRKRTRDQTLVRGRNGPAWADP